jgi:hypothetical protein
MLYTYPFCGSHNIFAWDKLPCGKGYRGHTNEYESRGEQQCLKKQVSASA